jgi:hypothetical protein
MAHPIQDDLDARLNELTDRDALWGPLLYLRPPQQRHFGLVRTCALSLLIGGFYGLLLDLVVALSLDGLGSLPSIYAMPLMLTVVSFIGLRMSLVPAWNRRAHALRRRGSFLGSPSS